MIERAAFELLQDRWASGEELSRDEDHARLAYAAGDPLAARELEVFAELGARLAGAGAPPPSVATARARARGVKLRVVLPGEVARSHGGTLRGVLVAAALLAAAAAAVVVLRRPHPLPAVAKASALPAAAVARVPALARSELVFASGDVTSGGERASVGGPTLAVGARIATRDGRACLSLDPGVDVCLAPNSELALASLDSADVRVQVLSGTAVAALTPRPAGHVFSLVAGGTVATAHGTVFALEANAARPQRVTVLEGSVAVATPGTPGALVGAHASLTLDGDVNTLATAGRGEEARLFAWLAPRELTHASQLGVLELGEQGARRALIDEQGPYGLPLRAFVAAGRHRIAWRGAAGADAVVELDVEAGGTSRVAPDGAPPSAPRGALADAAAPSARALLEQARERLVRGDARGARTLYERVRQSHPESAEAHTVLVSLGKLELAGGSPGRALALFDAYAERGGALLPEALSGRIKALRALGRHADERRAIEAYLASYPQSFEAHGLANRLATLAAP